MSTTMTIRLEPDVKGRLDVLAGATHRSKSWLAAEAIRTYIELNEWQVQETVNALAEADADKFATEEDVGKLASKWTSNAD